MVRKAPEGSYGLLRGLPGIRNDDVDSHPRWATPTENDAGWSRQIREREETACGGQAQGKMEAWDVRR